MELASVFNLRKYIDPKYKYAVYYDNHETSVSKLWSLHETEEDAAKQVKIEIEAYEDSERYDFHYKTF